MAASRAISAVAELLVIIIIIIISLASWAKNFKLAKFEVGIYDLNRHIPRIEANAHFTTLYILMSPTNGLLTGWMGRAPAAAAAAGVPAGRPVNGRRWPGAPPVDTICGWGAPGGAMPGWAGCRPTHGSIVNHPTLISLVINIQTHTRTHRHRYGTYNWWSAETEYYTCSGFV